MYSRTSTHLPPLDLLLVARFHQCAACHYIGVESIDVPSSLCAFISLIWISEFEEQLFRRIMKGVVVFKEWWSSSFHFPAAAVPLQCLAWVSTIGYFCCWAMPGKQVVCRLHVQRALGLPIHHHCRTSYGLSVYTTILGGQPTRVYVLLSARKMRDVYYCSYIHFGTTLDRQLMPACLPACLPACSDEWVNHDGFRADAMLSVFPNSLSAS